MKCLICGCRISEAEGDNMVAQMCIGCDIDSGVDEYEDPHGYHSDPDDVEED